MVAMQKLEVNFEPPLNDAAQDILTAIIIAFAEEMGSSAAPVFWSMEEVCDDAPDPQ